MSVKVHAAQTIGLEGKIIDVELDVSQGLRSFTIVGLADKAVDEARHRISYAIANVGYFPPHKKNQKVIASLAPADIKKEGPYFDLAIAVAYLLGSKQIQCDASGVLFLGELALDGTLRSVKGILPLVKKAQEKGFTSVVLPKGNGEEASFVRDILVYEAFTLADVADHLSGNVLIAPFQKKEFTASEQEYDFDMKDVRGQDAAKRALLISAAGGHNVGMAGPPGTGKTLLARALPSILPPLSLDEAFEVTTIHSVAGTLKDSFINERPFRSPHHTSSYVSLVGGGAFPKPGEITLAHRGVLFVDEFPEFDRRIIESLRQPLEDGYITVARARSVMQFPARFMLVAAMNPCPCGYFGSKTKECACSPASLFRYQRKMSGPIVDRIDVWVDVGEVPHEKLDEQDPNAVSSADMRAHVARARVKQMERFKNNRRKIFTNSEMNVRDLDVYAPLSREVKTTLVQAAGRLRLSARAYHRVIKIGRTIADLAGSADIQKNHIMEALQYRPKERSF